VTSSYSGGWAVSTDFNATVLAAAGPKETSHSWGANDFLSRVSGSIFATAVQKALCDGPTGARLGKEIVPQEIMDQLDETQPYSKFAKTIYQNFFIEDVDYPKRTGIPLAEFKTRFDALQDYAVHARYYVRE